MDRHQASGRAALGFGLACTTMLLWGLLPLALRVVLDSLDAWTITGFRFAASAVALLAFLAARGQLPRLGTLGARRLILLGVAMLFLAGNYIGYLLGLERTNAATAQVLIQGAPLLLALGGIVVFRERFERLQWLGFAVLVVGMLGFFRGQLASVVADVARFLDGAGWLAVAAVLWAVYGLAQKQLLLWLDSQGIMVCIYVGCALLFAPTADLGALFALDGLAWAMLLFTAANTLVAYGTFAAALEHWEASRVSGLLALTPLATLAFTHAAARLWPEAVDARAAGLQAFLWAGVVVVGSIGVALGGRRSG